MRKRIVCILVCMLFVTSAFGVMSYGKVVKTAREISTINESSIKFREETYSHVFAKVTPLDEKIFITNILQPAVVITSPEDGAVVTDPHLTVLGYASDEAGMNYWEWEWHYQGGSYSNSSYFETAEYVEFRIDIYGLHPGWNLVIVRFKNIYGAMGEDSVNVTYNPPDEEPPQVTIDSPATGTIFTHSHITVTGTATDNIGIVSIGAKQKWSEGETETSSTIPPTTYFPFEWDFDLYDGWNEITIYTEDAAGNRGEDKINITYVPEFPVRLTQLDFYLDDVPTINSDWGMMHLIFKGSDKILYLNLAINEMWAIQNLPVLSIEGKNVEQEQCFDFPLGVPSGTELTDVLFGYSLTENPITSPPEENIYTKLEDEQYIIYNGGADVIMHTKPLSSGPVIGGTVVDSAKNENFPNQEAGDGECVPTAVSNSLKFLKKKHNLNIKDEDITIEKMKKACNWGEKHVDGKTVKGAWIFHDDNRPAGEKNAWWEDKDKYMKNHNLPITTKKVSPDKIDDIIKEMKAGQDIEAELKGHTVSVVGIAKLANGKYSVTVAHDKEQGKAGGCVTETGVWDPATKTWSGALSGYGLNYFVVECPKKENKPPNKPNKPSGPTSGKAGTSYTYSTSTTDPDGDQVYYWFDWGDGTNSGWLGPYNSGQTVSASHTWSEKGSYNIKVKAKDTNDAESDWSDPLPITMPKSKGLPFNVNFWWFIKNFLKI